MRSRLPARADFQLALRLTVAAMASYVVATLIFPEAEPLLAPLTAMLVVQVTPVSLLASGLDRVVAVIAGIAIAVLFSARVPLTWWSLGLLILTAITVGQVLRLRANLIEVAISAMLVLGVGSLAVESAAWERLTETLVGAAVGVAINLALPPKVATEDAGEALEGFAGQLSGVLRQAADELTEAVSAGSELSPLPPRWLEEARRITRDFPAVESAVLRAEEGRRLNVRAAFSSDAGPGLRQGLEALEHTGISVRTMFRAVADAVPIRADVSREVKDDLALVLAQTLHEMAAGVDAFGALVRLEATPGREPAEVATLTGALEGLHEARARLEELLVSVSTPELVEPTAALLTTVRRLLREMDLDERVRRQMRLAHRARARRSSRPGARPDDRQVARPDAGPAGSPPQPPQSTQVDPDAATEIFNRIKRDRDG